MMYSAGSYDGQRGVASVEMAVTLIVFLMLSVGIVDFGRAIWVNSTLSHVAAKGARFAAVHSNDSDAPVTAADVKARVAAEAPGLDPDRLVVSTTWEPASVRGGLVQVQVSYVFEPVTPLIPVGSIGLEGSSRMTITN